MALDIPEFYRQARTQFAVRHKNSNQLLGYALLLPEVAVKDYEVRIISTQLILLLLFITRRHNLLDCILPNSQI